MLFNFISGFDKQSSSQSKILQWKLMNHVAVRNSAQVLKLYIEILGQVKVKDIFPTDYRSHWLSLPCWRRRRVSCPHVWLFSDCAVVRWREPGINYRVLTPELWRNNNHSLPGPQYSAASDTVRLRPGLTAPTTNSPNKLEGIIFFYEKKKVWK